MMAEPRKFRWKVFASLYITISMLVIGASGLVLFVAPPGRIAHWSDWTLGGLSKDQWQSVHAAFAFIFLVVVAVHVYFNWRVLLSYLRSILRNKELTAAAGASLVIGVMTIAGWPPFGSLMDLGEGFKQSWADERTEPPIPHAESMTLERLCRLSGLELDDVVSRLEQLGFAAHPEATVRELATRQGLTPQQLFEKLRLPSRPATQAGPGGHGRGFGRKTVGEICSSLDLDATTALARLRRSGIDAGAGDTLRTLALEHGRSPSELVELMQGL